MSTSPQSPVRTALAGLIGNVLEWFDFAVYGYLNHQIGAKFFTGFSPERQQTWAFAVFWLGFLARPVGSVVLGRVGDRIGRRALLTLSIALMGASTLAIGLLPGFEAIGVAAPILLIAMRLLQGFSLGGEFTGSMVYTTELASPMLRGLISSSTAAGTSLGFILGSLAVYLVRRSVGEAALADWGWRIPFIASVIFCIVGYFLRHGIVEPEESAMAKSDRTHWMRGLIRDRKPILMVVRDRRHDECRVLPDVHVRDRDAQRGEGPLRPQLILDRERVRAVPRARVEAARWVPLR